MSMMLAAIYGGAAAPAPEGPLVYDNFDGPLDDPLHNRESDSGHTWSDPDNYHSLDGGGAAVPTVGAAGGSWYAVVETGESDGVITAILDWNKPLELVVRYVDENNYVVISVARPNDFVEVSLLNIVSGTPTQVGFNPVAPISPGETTINVILDGTSVSVEVEGNELVAASIPDHVSATEHGFGIFDDSLPTKLLYWELDGLA